MSTENVALRVRKIAGRSMSEQELDDLMAAYRLQVDGARWRSEAGVHLAVSDTELTVFPHPAPMGFQNEVASLLNHMGWTHVKVVGGDAEWISAFYRYSGSLEVDAADEQLPVSSPVVEERGRPPFVEDVPPAEEQVAWRQHDIDYPPPGEDLVIPALDEPVVAAPAAQATPAPAAADNSVAGTPLSFWDNMNGRISVDACPSLSKAREGVREFLASQGIPMDDVSVEAGMRVRGGRLAHFAFIVEFGNSVELPT